METNGHTNGSAKPGSEYDVIIVGGGPVGLLMAYQLKRFGVLVAVFEQHEKETQDTYGRAIALFPRTMEQLDQLELADPMLQLGFACRSSVTYKDGKQVIPGRVWTFMENMSGSAFNFTMVLRQMYTEEILRGKLRDFGIPYFQGVECTDFFVDAAAADNTYAVTATMLNRRTKETSTVKSKYIVGADGGRSFVRQHAGIAFDGDQTEDQWVRIDGIVETDMPITRSYGAIESKTHGNVLWAPLDHGATRIGYAYSAAIAAKHPGGITQAIAEQEASESMRPFSVVFRETHWWTLYTIGQRMARDFAAHSHRVFLCGDAAHTHSSGAAQGLNTGIHDAVNLAWKLALYVRGLLRPAVLHTYTTERRAVVQQLIRYDRDIATLMSRKWPDWYTGDRLDTDPYAVLAEIFDEAASFNTGLGISYPANVINKEEKGEKEATGLALSVLPGHRPPDVVLSTPGTGQTVRFQQVTRNHGCFWVVVLAGQGSATKTSLKALAAFLADHPRLASPAVRFLTIAISQSSGSTYEALGGIVPFGGCTFYDTDGTAHAQLGVSTDNGAILILRPDGLLGSGGAIRGEFVKAYFENVLNCV